MRLSMRFFWSDLLVYHSRIKQYLDAFYSFAKLLLVVNFKRKLILNETYAAEHAIFFLG